MNHNGMNHGGSGNTTSGIGLNFSIEVKDILFSGWSTDSSLTYIIALVSVFFASGLLECLNCMKQNVYKTYSININDPQLRLSKWKNIWKYKLYLMILHVITLAFHYALMLIIMSFNLGLIISVLIGAGLGYLVFLDNPISSSGNNNHSKYIPLKETNIIAPSASNHCTTSPSTIIVNSYDGIEDYHDHHNNNHNDHHI